MALISLEVSLASSSTFFNSIKACRGFFAIRDLLNQDRDVIPRGIIDKPPSAELRPGQKDSDSLPPYDVLDAILDLYIEEGHSAAEIVARGFERDTVTWVVEAVRKNEYKRRQAAPGLKVTSKAFGGGRRYPIAARYPQQP
jgi:NH3-dependent NAD+ synthetase